MAARYWTVSWDDFRRDARTLADQLAGLGPYRGIVAITRGGLLPATLLAHALDIRVVETVSIAAYGQDGQGQEFLGTPVVTKSPDAAGDGTGFLLVDDLVDTGATACVARALLPKARFVCVYAKPAGRAFTDHFVTEVSQDTWIVLPWEKN